MFSSLQNLYWHIRYNRNRSIKRRYYRYVAAEKKRLLQAGVDPEELRLLCRALSVRYSRLAENRLKNYRENRIKNQLFCGIFCVFPIAYNLYYVKLTVDVTIEGLRTKYKTSFSIFGFLSIDSTLQASFNSIILIFNIAFSENLISDK